MSAIPVSAQSLAYPPSPRQPQVDLYHGIEVADPYRWLEDPQSAETQAWIEAQNQLTFDYLAALPGRDTLNQRLTALWNYERYGVVPFRTG